jgi:hypothetical protein
MKKLVARAFQQLSLVFLLLITVANCTGPPSSTHPDTQEMGGINLLMSECGGFETPFTSQNPASQGGDCRTERLIWHYMASSETVRFRHQNLYAGCSANFAVDIVFHPQARLYDIHERDQFTENPLPCLCFYDIQADIPHVEMTAIRVRISGWEGVIDLRKGAGTEVIREEVGACVSPPQTR